MEDRARTKKGAVVTGEVKALSDQKAYQPGSVVCKELIKEGPGTGYLMIRS